MQTLYSLKQAANKLSISPHMAHLLVKSKKLKGRRFGGNTSKWLFTDGDITRCIDENLKYADE